MLFSLLFLWPITLPLAIVYIYVVWWLARGRRRILLATALIFPILAYQAGWLYFFYTAIPAEISIAHPVSINNEDNGYCGAAIFKVSKETLSAIADRGIEFFESTTQPRGNADVRVGYKKWSESPTPTEWDSAEGSWLHCSSIGENSYARIISEAKKGGSYFTTGPKGTLVIIPSLGYVVLSFVG